MEISDVHDQVTAGHPWEEVLVCSKTQQPPERKLRPHPDQALKCPRCDSTNTKFCYYNNYSLSQPRYFCKGCRRYWTQGGSLRNVPVGGGSRKNKRSSCSSKRIADQDPTANYNPVLPSLIPPPLSFDPSGLTLAFASLHKQPTTKQLGLEDYNNFLLGHPNHNPSTSSIPTAPSNGFLDILRSGFGDTTGASGAIRNLYYGFVGNVNGEGGVSGEEVMLPFEGGFGGATTTTTQGSCKVMDEGENKLLMELQWPVEGDSKMVMESGRDIWNGVGSSWHGLMNSSLM